MTYTSAIAAVIATATTLVGSNKFGLQFDNKFLFVERLHGTQKVQTNHTWSWSETRLNLVQDDFNESHNPA